MQLLLQQASKKTQMTNPSCGLLQRKQNYPLHQKELAMQ
jgi:hypothetical protein